MGVGRQGLGQRVRPDHLTDDHRKENLVHYARNPVYSCPEGTLSIFAMVWLPGQWTLVHDHGTWGVVGVVEGKSGGMLLALDAAKGSTAWARKMGPVFSSPALVGVGERGEIRARLGDERCGEHQRCE